MFSHLPRTWGRGCLSVVHKMLVHNNATMRTHTPEQKLAVSPFIWSLCNLPKTPPGTSSLKLCLEQQNPVSA